MMYFLIINLFLFRFDNVLAVKNYTQIVDVHLSSFKCSHHLYSSLNRIFEVFPLPVYNDDIGMGYMKNGTFYALQTSTEISDKCQDDFILNSELLEQLQEISHFIKFF